MRAFSDSNLWFVLGQYRVMGSITRHESPRFSAVPASILPWGRGCASNIEVDVEVDSDELEIELGDTQTSTASLDRDGLEVEVAAEIETVPADSDSEEPEFDDAVTDETLETLESDADASVKRRELEFEPVRLDPGVADSPPLPGNVTGVQLDDGIEVVDDGIDRCARNVP